MKYPPINSELFIENRKRLAQLLEPGSIAIFQSNDIMPTSADGTMPFVQDADLYYLTGIDQEETVLVLFPDFPDEKLREVLFVKQTNAHIAVWEGHKYTKEGSGSRFRHHNCPLDFAVRTNIEYTYGRSHTGVPEQQ